VVTVRDTGHWRSARGHDRGRGTTLIQQCTDDLDVVTGPAGTTVTFRRDLSRELR